MNKKLKDSLAGLIAGLLFFVFFGVFRGGLWGVEILISLVPNSLFGLLLIGLLYTVVAVIIFPIVALILRFSGKIIIRSIFFGMGFYVSYLPVVLIFLQAFSNFQIL